MAAMIADVSRTRATSIRASAPSGLPQLFYLVCCLMLLTGRLDAAQIHVAWLIVGLRALHALIYTGWNHLPLRFGSYVAGFATLSVLWTRFVLQAWDLVVAR